MNSTTKITRLTLIFLFVSFANIPAILAQTEQVEPFYSFLIAQKSKRVRFPIPPIGAPGSRKGGASRGACPVVEKPLTALVPPTNIGLTISERPTFWFYIPYNPTPARSVEFVLLNDKKNAVYRTTVPIKDTPGIINIVLPSTAPALESGKRYQWVFSVICDPSNRTEDIFVRGEVRRDSLNSNLNSQLAAAKTERERIVIYAANGLWYDALTALAKLRRSSPQDITLANDWQGLLNDVGLNEIASEHIVP